MPRSGSIRYGGSCWKASFAVLERAGRYGRAALRWLRLLAARRSAPGVRVFYGHDRVPGPGEPVAGGTAKFQRLAGRFPNSPTDFSLLYLGSTWLPRDLRPLLWLARRRRAPVVVNQSGVAYPGWAGAETEAINREFRRALLAAEHVLYQSEFCKRSADEFLGEPKGSWEVLYNAVDVGQFTPGVSPPAEPPVLLLGGDQTQSYRLELALRTLAQLPDARLIVTGRLVSDPQPLLRELGLADRVELAGRYAQADAPALFRRAHLLLHTKVLDPCPSLVIEAMACGLPVVYAASGGTVELVGDEAGIGVPHTESWEQDEPPPPEAFADAVRRVVADRDRYAAAARGRSERFALGPWLDRHAEVFEALLKGGAPPARSSRTR
jgi:glycosyltransferase involved in cell wall biosynthesis